MIKPIKIAIDLDGVIIDKPPIIPKDLLEYLFKGPIKNKLNYRFPKTKLEQTIRKISHFYLFRPPLKKNIEILKQINLNPRYQLIAISSRYHFLEKETKKWLVRRQLNNLFNSIYLNLDNEQPHLFKEKLLKKIQPNAYIDDDFNLISYLSKRIKGTKLFYLSNKKIHNSNITSIPDLKIFL